MISAEPDPATRIELAAAAASLTGLLVERVLGAASLLDPDDHHPQRHPPTFEPAVLRARFTLLGRADHLSEAHQAHLGRLFDARPRPTRALNSFGQSGSQGLGNGKGHQHSTRRRQWPSRPPQVQS